MSRLPCPLPYLSWHPEVQGWLDQRPSERWAVAVSGGADSRALLLAVSARARAVGGELVVLHFDHGLRGSASDADAQCVIDWAKELGWPIRVARWEDGPKSHVSEGEAREARLTFFQKTLSDENISVLFTGHHADDVAETLWLRVARGVGAGGLSSPRPVQPHPRQTFFVRPLLTWRKAELEESLRAQGVTWREDVSNQDLRHPRNSLRHRVMALWTEAVGRDAIAGAGRTRQLLQEDEEALQSWVDRLWGAQELSAAAVSLAPLRGAPLAIWRRALHRWAPAVGLSSAGFDQLLRLCQEGRGRMSLHEGWAEVREGQLFHVLSLPGEVRSPPSVSLRAGQTVRWGEAELSYEFVSVTPEQIAAIRAGQVDARFECWLAPVFDQLEVRGWEAGDRFAPLGLGGSSKVQDLWVNRKVPMESRGLIPLVVAEHGEVVWIPGFPPADRLRVEVRNRTLGRLTYREGTSTVFF